MVVVGGGVVDGVVVGGGAVGGVVGGGCVGVTGEVVGVRGGVVGVGGGALGAFELDELFPLAIPDVSVVDVLDEGDVEVLPGMVEADRRDDPIGLAGTTTDHVPHLSEMFAFT